MTLISNEATRLAPEGLGVKAALPPPDQLTEVARLSTLLAEQVVTSKGPISADQAVALAKAARLLQDHNMEWPEILTRAIYELAEETPASSPPNDVLARSSVESVVISMASFAARSRPQSR